MAEVSVSASWLYTVLYDGDCAVCTRFAALSIRLDRGGKLEVWPSQTPGVRRRFPHISPEAFDEPVQVVDREGRVWRGVPAVARIFRALPGGLPLAWLLGLSRVGPLAERLYRALARNRHRLRRSANHAVSPDRPPARRSSPPPAQ